MRLKNKYNLPEWITDKIDVYRPDPRVLRVTELIDAPLKKNLQVQEWDRLSFDCADFLTAESGTAIHQYYESSDPMEVCEETLEVPYRHNGAPLVIRGTCDAYNSKTGTIRDIKTRGYRPLGPILGSVISQCNVYAWMRRQIGQRVRKLEAWIWYRDWTKMKYIRNPEQYPTCQWEKFELDLWSFEEQDEYVKERVRLHLDHPLDECTPNEKWRTPSSYAIHVEGKARPICTREEGGIRKPFTTVEEATEFVEEKGLTRGLKNGTVVIEERLGAELCCNFFCPVRHLCKFRKKGKINERST